MGTYLIIVVLLVLSGVFSGLNLGLMSLSPHELKRKIKLGDKNAKKIYPIRKDGNLLLVTLLLGNVAVNAALSVFLGSITIGLLAILISTALITVFGEIIPQAILSRHALAIGARFVWLVKVFKYLLYPVSAPLAWALNRMLGKELPILYTKKELLSILEEHSNNIKSDLEEHEEQIASGALSYGEKKIADVMTPLKSVVSLDANTFVDNALEQLVRERGHTRYPVYKKSATNFIGVLNVKDLLGAHDGQKIFSLARKPIHFVRSDAKLDKVLRVFLKKRNHLFAVADKSGRVVGIVTIEDIIEEILQEEIIDEFDDE